MVAPTRTPQVRGVKCNLCKKILSSATWLDQTKLAKDTEEAKAVLGLISQHEASECPCVPKNIENLLIGSTHFEIHRLTLKRLDAQVQEKHDYSLRQQESNSKPLRNVVISDCDESRLKESRFFIYGGYNDQKSCRMSKDLLKHLIYATDYWKLAMEDQANPFNPKLALRLGLTHHVIYACYLFKFYKRLDYQLITANLLLNLFKSIEGVTANAVLHANYLLVKSLMDCNQLQLARQYLKQATKIPNYQEKTHYESILLTCVSCELSLLDSGDTYSVLDELANLAKIKPDDKLQHYYARTLAISLVVKYIHCYPARSDLCFEFYHTFRYIGAIARRCYEDSFKAVLPEEDSKQQQKAADGQHRCQKLDHSWIRFAVCDLAFSTFDLLSNFYIRAGQPEYLKLLYNGLNLIAYRTGSCYWQSRMAIIGASLDSICDKHDDASAKLDIIKTIMDQESDDYLKNLLHLDLDLSRMSLLEKKNTLINKEVITSLLQEIQTCQNSLTDRLFKIDLFDCHANSFWKTINNNSEAKSNNSFIVLGNILGHLSLKAVKTAILSMLRAGEIDYAKDLICRLGTQFNSTEFKIFEFDNCQTLLEILIHFADIHNSDKLLIEAVDSCQLFLRADANLASIESQLSMLTISGEPTEHTTEQSKKRTAAKPRLSRLNIKGSSRRRGTYDVASRSQESLHKQDTTTVRFFDTIETLKNFTTLSREELVVSYLRNSEPNPDYLIYRHAHELMLCFRLKENNQNQEQLLYHFCESSSSNTMRYRWMMFEEQQASPYEPCTRSPVPERYAGNIKRLAFSGIMADTDKAVKTLARVIPEDSRLVQLKYIVEKKTKQENLIMVTFDHQIEPVYVWAKRPILSGDFFEEVSKKENQFQSLTIANKLATKVQEAMKTLSKRGKEGHDSRIEQRHKIEKEISSILKNLEDDWLGPFKFLLFGKIIDSNYNHFVEDLANEIQSLMREHSACNSLVALRIVLENAPLLNREEFCKLISALFNCVSTSNEVRDCFKKWTRSIETFMNDQASQLCKLSSSSSNSSKLAYLQTLSRGHVGLIIDQGLELVPFESLPIVRTIKQGIFRVPSLRLFNIIASRNGPAMRVLDSDETAYILDPEADLNSTRNRFENRLRSKKSWIGIITNAPQANQLEQWLSTKQVYLYIGHGAGSKYYDSLCRSRGLSAMQLVKANAIVMGCSSGQVLSEGPRLESFGIGWVFVLRGSPSYLGLLWDVTDIDIDRFLDRLLENWMGHSRWSRKNTSTSTTTITGSSCGGSAKTANSEQSRRTPAGRVASGNLSIAEATALARRDCQFRFLTGATPVIYGLPTWCK